MFEDDVFAGLLEEPTEPAPKAAPKAKAGAKKAGATKSGAKKAAAPKAAPKAKAGAKKAAAPKAPPKAKTVTVPADKRDRLKIGTVLVSTSKKYGDHKLKVVAATAAIKAKRPDAKVAYQLDGKSVYASTSAAAIKVMGTLHGNGWAFFKLPVPTSK